MENFNFDFSQLEQISKKFSRKSSKGGGRKTFKYTGLRYTVSSKGKHTISASDSLWEKMQLDSNSMRASIAPNGKLLVFLVPESSKYATIFTEPKTNKKTGERCKKSRSINSKEFIAAMVKTGLVNEISDPAESVVDNKPTHQYVKFTKVENSQFSNLPSDVIGVYVVEKDGTDSDETELVESHTDEPQDEPQAVNEVLEEVSQESLSFDDDEDEDEDDF
jgi:hypothetical protein